MADPTSSPSGISPYDTPLSSGLRFLIELGAWVAGPWAVVDATGSGWTAAPALVVLFGLPALFNTPGDKKVTGVPTPGPIRIIIEFVLLATAVAGAWMVWPVWAAMAISVLGVLMVIAGMRRYQWLIRGGGPV